MCISLYSHFFSTYPEIVDELHPTGYPTTKPEVETPEVRDEKHFPNGTVIGRYTYMDNEGNPIQVKYYADDASYG